MNKFNIATINQNTKAEGPFSRMAIWFQGCNIRCIECCNMDLWNFVPKHILSIEEIVDIAKEAKEKYSIEGITYLGGEPTLQKNLDKLSYE